MKTRPVWRPRGLSGALLILLIEGFVMSGLHLHAQREAEARGDRRNFDARAASGASQTQLRQSVSVSARADGLARLKASIPELMVTFDDVTGATRSIYNATGFLTGPGAGNDPLAAGLAWVTDNLDALGLVAADLLGYEITDRVDPDVSEVTHIYLRQRVNGIGVYNAQLQLNVDRQGRLLSVNNQFVPDLASVVTVQPIALDAGEAVTALLQHYGDPLGFVPVAGSFSGGPERETTISDRRVSPEPVRARLMYLPTRPGEVRLVWSFQITTADANHKFDSTVDASTGKVWTRFDWVAADSYRVFAAPAESPNRSTPLPPADGRVLLSNPTDAVGAQAPSPFGWHDTNGAAGAEFTTARGNNVHAYDDTDSDNAPPAAEPDCGASLACVFGVDFASEPSANLPAAITNLFYWTNLVHDIQYRFGFNEVAGNFQANNYGRGGSGNDFLNAEAQDGSGINNASMMTPPEGENPRMQMYRWVATTPDRDSAFDAGVIVHEYGHGISNRLVGGPSNVDCLSNAQQPGEGLSDWWALAYTATAADTGPMGRGIGTYLLGQPSNGLGIRGQRYSTDQNVNNWTYQSIRSFIGEHAIGQVWAQGAWEMYWALVNQYGFQSLSGPSGGAGNHRAMLYVNEGLKNTSCSPAFTDVRDGIIQAAVSLNGGADVCRLWDAFAAFGLGSDAMSGGPNSTNATNGFNKPASCGGTQPSTLGISDSSVIEGDSGQRNASVTVSLTPARSNVVSVDYATADATASPIVYPSTGVLNIPTFGNAAPYPSSIAVPSLIGAVTKVTVSLEGFSHTWPSDVSVLLVGPTGQSLVLMAEAGSTFGVSNVNLVFDDAGPALGNAITSGTYKPTNPMSRPGGNVYPAPAPAGPYGSTLAAFNGLNPGGTWQLFVVDGIEGDQGSIEGWSLKLTLRPPPTDYVPVSGRLTFQPGETSRTIQIPVLGDILVEGNESVDVVLGNAAGAVIGDATGVVTIIDDDAVSVPVPGSTDRIAFGLTPYQPAGGWLTIRHGAESQLGVSAWRNVPFESYNKVQGGMLRLAAGDVDGDGLDEIVAAVGTGGGGYMAVLDDGAHGYAFLKWIRVSWPLYNAANGEVWPAVGDLDGDGKAEIVAGLGAGGEGWFEIFDDASASYAHIAWRQVDWPAYNASASGATHPAIGNVDGVGASEIIVGLGTGGGGWIEVVSGAAAGYSARSWFQVDWSAYNAANGSTFPAAGDLDGDGRAEIIAGLGQGGGGWMQVSDDSASGYRLVRWLRLSWPAYNARADLGETHPAIGNIDADNRAEVVVGLGPCLEQGGWFESFDDELTGSVSLGWRNLEWAEFSAAGGGTFPAIGRFRD